MKILVTVPEFFRIPLKKVEIEARPWTGRTYFIHQGKIVAVATLPREPEYAVS